MFEFILGACALFAWWELNRIADALEHSAKQLERIGDDIEAIE